MDAGEALIDDISVLRSPDGAATQLIENGSFQSDATGGSANRWNIIGNHSGTVVVDPDNPGNRVLYLVATGATGHIHNHAQSTFLGNAAPVNGTEYEISFRAKWLRGSNQLSSRFYVSRVAGLSLLELPVSAGTPGLQNSTFDPNAGPTYSDFGHVPLVPDSQEQVTVSVTAEDPDDVSSMKLWWSVNAGSWQSTAMALGSGGVYSGVIPGQSANIVTQFYVEGSDSLGETSTYPAAGRDSRALFEVQDGQGTSRPIDTFRLIMLSSEATNLFETNPADGRCICRRDRDPQRPGGLL